MVSPRDIALRVVTGLKRSAVVRATVLAVLRRFPRLALWAGRFLAYVKGEEFVVELPPPPPPPAPPPEPPAPDMLTESARRVFTDLQRRAREADAA